MSRRLTRVTITSALLLLAALMLAGPALAIHNTGKFQLDGNTGGTSSGLPDDWDNVYRSVTGKGAAHPSSALVQQFTTDSGEPDYSTFGPGNKDFQRVSQWTCNSDNNPQGKTNVLSAFAAVYNVSGHLDLFFGADRESNSGDANFGFWLFQSPVSCVPADKGGTGHFSGHKTHGDIFLVSEFTSGGTISKVKVYKWTDPDGIPENGDECLGDGVDCSSAHSGQAHPFATGVDCQSSNPHASNPNICATVNTAGYKSAWRTCTAARELFEGGIDLTALLGANATCFASFMAEARASQQFDADLKDYVIGELGTCGEITIRKKALGGDDHFDFDVMTGSLTPHPFTLQNGSAQSFSAVKAGAYAVKELAAPAGWQLTDIKCATSGGDTSATPNVGASTVNIAMGLAGTVDCTFTNSRFPTLTVIKKVVNNYGGTLTTSDFTLKVDGATVTSGVGAALPAGTHTVSEGSLPTGYVQVGITGDCNAYGKVTLNPGDTKTCTITNKDIAPQLKVIKHVVNDDGGAKTAADFTIQVAGTGVSSPSFPGSETGTIVTLKAGAYSVDEVAVAGYAKSLSADCAGTIAVGVIKTCTVTNDDLVTKLVVIKKVNNTHGGTKAPGDFTLTVTGNAPSPASFPGADSPGTTVTIKAGSYSVDEVAVAGYAKSLSADCAGTIAAGQTKTCTVTNSDIAPKLTVIKHVINDNGGTALAGSFTMQVAGASVSTPSFPGSEAGTSVTLNTGSYNVDELPVVGYAKSLSGDCAGTIALGESKTCTITNDDVAPRLTVIKHVVNDNGGTAAAGSFTMQVTGAGVSTPSFPGSEAGTTVTLDTGAYGVDELPAPGYARSIGADCAGTIALGETKTCAITNDDIAPRLVVVKNVINDNGGGATPASFTMTVTGNTPSPASFPGAGGAGTTVALKAGAYSVSESGPSGYAGTFSADCSGTINLGQTRTCVVTNDDIPPALIVIKHVVNSHGGSAVAAQFTMIVTGTNVSAPSFAGSEAGTTVTLNAGAYSADEISAAGYLKTLSADCAGSIALGETRTCLVTNNDPPPFPRLPFCDEPTVLAVLDPASGRFPNNRGPDVIVDARTGSIQAAINAASDTNGDGLIIIGVVAKDNLQAGGVVDQSIDLSKAYGKPFALVACGVLLHDPLRCDGIAAVSVHASATSPEYPVGSGVTLYIHGLSSQYSQSSPGFMVEGNGRYIEGASVTDSMIGVKIVGNRNTVHNGYMHGNLVSGVVVEGNGNVIDTVQSVDNAGGDGIQVTGSGNTVVRSTAGGQGAGNGGNGITVSGTSNLIASNSAFANTGDGINVGGGTAANPNIVSANIAGTPYRGNGGNGIVVAGTGSGASSPIEIESNTTQSNGLTGVKVTGTGHQLKKNVSGGFKAKTNGLCEFEVGAGNINATGNTSGIKSILGADGSAFPTGCK